MTSVLAPFFGALAGQVVGGVLVWRYYLAPKFKRAGGALPRPTPPRSQPTATTAGFVAHDRPVTVQRAQWAHSKKRTHF